MEMPPIRYTSTEDGISIAYLDVGEGTPILHIPYPMNHLQLQWEHAVFRDSLEGFASRFRLVAFDGRGQGLSDRQTDENSVEKIVIDTEAVVRATGLERFALFSGFSSPVARSARNTHCVDQLREPLERAGQPRLHNFHGDTDDGTLLSKNQIELTSSATLVSASPTAIDGPPYAT